MQTQVASVPDRALLVDCYAPLTEPAIQRLAAATWQGRTPVGCVRYHDNLTAPEIGWILAAGWGLMTVGVARQDAMRSPSAGLGARDGLTAVRNLKALGIPQGVTNWLDVEGTVGCTADAVAAYVNGADSVIRIWTESGMYDGWADPLSAAALYQRLTVKRYWASSPSTLAPAVRGFGMVQLVENIVLAGVQVDVDEHRVDLVGDSCHWLIAA